MKAIVFGAGAREHALADRLSREAWTVTVAPGNGGLARQLPCRALDLADGAAAVALAQQLAVDLAVVGPEAPLIAGLADALRAVQIPTFGPSAAAAQIEGSKAFAKELMAAAKVPTARYAVAERTDDACAFARSLGGKVVVKADGIAAGKGVVVAEDQAAAEAAIHAFLDDGKLGPAGRRLVLEEMLEGPEVSLMALCHGTAFTALPLAHDYKRIFDRDLGANTGGMGAVAPSPRARDLDALAALSIAPVLATLAARGTPFSGLLYAGLMLTPDGPKVLEYNCRFGDPETQALLWAVAGPLGQALLAVARGQVDATLLRPSGRTAVAVVAAAPGYPAPPTLGGEITGLAQAQSEAAAVYSAGVAANGPGLVTAGGRVLTVVGVGLDVARARAQAYDALSRLRFDGLQSRGDIGL